MLSQVTAPLLPHLTPVLPRSLALHSHLPCCSHCGLLAFNTPTHQPSTQHNLQHTNTPTHQPSTQPSTYQPPTTFNTRTHQPSTQCNLQHNLQQPNTPAFNTTQPATFNTPTHQTSTQPSITINTTFSCLQHTNRVLPRGSSQPFPLLQRPIPRHPDLLQVFA